ncbi:MAG: hypothetical protein C7B45_01500 [Sulfobacillus acidophilus]|uniref:Uncharacterized protein n=1 Tax=Sulfobacillus acidophilus TaxID=53633 RepID=A0A2T2WNA0_9FIRM|nr:MAG: hypothetical protein C7B45_01500 [Sulfobacillus acidophilus]
MKTRMTELLGSQYPIIRGCLAHIAIGEFAPAVSNVGAFGQITATGVPEPEDVVAEVDAVRQRTSRPFGVNVAIVRWTRFSRLLFE